MNSEDRKNSIFGYLSFALGLVNICITLIIVIALNQITGGIPNRNIINIVDILNKCSFIESYTKSIGVIFGLIGVFYKSSKSRKKTMAVVGLVTNIITIIWTVLIIK